MTLSTNWLDRLSPVLESNPRVAYALVFGSRARGTGHADSDIDVAIGPAADARCGALELGELISRISDAAGADADIVLMNEAPPGLAYRVFRDGRVVAVRDRQALVARRARAILEYLDFCPFEDLIVRGVLAARHGR